MNISFVFRHMDRSIALENHTVKELERVKRFFKEDENVSVDVVLDAARIHHHHKVEIRLHNTKGLHIIATEEGPDIYQAVEHTIKKILKEAKKHKEKMLDKRNHPSNRKDLFEEGLLADDEVV